MSIIGKLTEGIQARSVANESKALVGKWEATGLLEGLASDIARDGMARLLENQAAQLLKEESTMAGGDVEGFAAVAFPLVRRVFGGLIAQELVSVQPMSLPSGLVFFMDFQRGTASGHNAIDESVYGGRVVAKGLQGGVDFGNETEAKASEGPQGFYNLDSGYASAHATVTITDRVASAGAIADGKSIQHLAALAHTEVIADTPAGNTMMTAIRADADLLDYLATTSSHKVAVLRIQLSAADWAKVDGSALSSVKLAGSNVVRRLTTSPAANKLDLVVIGDSLDISGADATDRNLTFASADPLEDGGAVGSVIPVANQMLHEPGNAIAEIDLKVDSVAVTAVSKKLKAKWTPELAQDLNAYHSVDAEVELTSVLSEMIGLEIDQEILGDLIAGAKCGTYHWSRVPGTNLNRTTGNKGTALDFTGSVSEWYETLLEVINDLSAVMHRKTLRGGANFLVCSPDVASILEFTAAFRASVGNEDEKGSWGPEKVGSLSKKMDIYVDPYFPRSLVLVGRRGSGFLESGYVYAPYVPLQVTPTIIDPATFKPVKGVSTRFAKEMVRPDMYGLVVVHDLLMG